MAIAKQTAKRSTGGKAPRAQTGREPPICPAQLGSHREPGRMHTDAVSKTYTRYVKLQTYN
jgi:hypothetical protein